MYIHILYTFGVDVTAIEKHEIHSEWIKNDPRARPQTEILKTWSKCVKTIVFYSIWARDRPFRLDETRASVTKYRKYR